MYQLRAAVRIFTGLLILLIAVPATAQTATYHLHQEASTTSGLFRAAANPPDTATVSIQSALLSGPGGSEYVIKEFDTLSGVPRIAGVVLAGMPVSFTLWMRTTFDPGSVTIYPRARVHVTNASGVQLCEVTGAAPLTATLAPYTLSCSTSATIPMTAADRFYMWVGVTSASPLAGLLRSELHIEGTLNGPTDSQIVVPLPIEAPAISSVNPSNAQIGKPITITGQRFGATKGASTVAINGTSAATSSWSDTSIAATVPTGASSGPIVVTVNGQSSNGFAFVVTTGNTVSYGYDALGRLTSVTDANGNTATYSYDAVGNLLSIARTSTALVFINSFTPTSGFAGETFTISGSGFSSTPAANAVSFNGKPAVVTSSTPTTLTTTVPLGASSGPISVTTSAGGAISSSNFVVLGAGQDPNAPAISGFTPSGGAPGTTVEITGTNFAASPGSNQVRFNGTAATVTSATATNLSTSVPAGATTGPITVITPAGQANTSSDFIVPPPPYTLADLENVERIAYYETRTIDIATAGKVAVLTFAGTAGDWVNIVFEEVTLHLCDAEAFLRDPSGVLIYSDCAYSQSPGIRLTTTGTYSLVIAPESGLTGSLRVTVVPDLIGSVTVDGPAVRVANRVPYQNVRLRFAGVAGERVAIAASEIIPISSFLGIARDDGTYLPNADYVLRYGCSNGCFLAETLPATGTYMVVVDPELDDVGSMTLTVTHPPADATATITPGGAPVNAANTAAGQRIAVAFDGTAGQRVSFKVTGSVNIFTSIFLRAPNGSVLASGQMHSGLNYIDALTLPSTGVYHILVEPPGTNVGNVTVTLYNVVDLVTTATVGGPSVPLAVSTPGQNGRIGVDAIGGQRLGALLSAVSISSSLVSVLDPAGLTIVAPSTMTTSGKFLDWVPVTTGTYTIVVDPQGESTGNATLSVAAPSADVTGTLIPGGSPLTITTTSPGQNAQVTFTATAGQRVSLRMTSVTIPSSTVTIRKPDGSTLASTTVSTSGGFIDTNTLTASGDYSITIDPAANGTGSMTLTLFDVPLDANVPATIDGPPVTVTVGTPGEGVLVTFTGATGQHVAINLTAVSISSSNVSLLKPDGTILLSPVSVTTSGRFLDAVMPTAGTYTLRIDPVATATGSMTAALTTIPADIAATIAPDGSPLAVSIASAGQNANVTFTGGAGQRISLRMTSVTISSSSVTILRPDGTTLVTTSVSTSGGFIDTNVLSASGTYTIVINPSAAATGSMTLTLYDVPADLTGAITPDGTPVTVSIGTAGQNARLTFTATLAQRISLRISSVTIPSVTVSILSPDGIPISGGTVTVGTGGGFIDLRTLQANGTFTISVNPASTNTGSVTLTLYTVPSDITKTVTVNGPAEAIAVGTPGQNAAVTFDGTQGDSVTVGITGNTIGSVTVSLLRPDNTVMTSVTSSAGSFNLTPQSIGITGPYRIVINPATTNTGTISVAVTKP